MGTCYPLESLEMGTWLWLNATILAPLLPISLAFGAAHLISTSSDVPKEVYQHISRLRSWALVALNRYVTDVMQDSAKSVDDNETAMVVGGFLAFEVSRFCRLSGIITKALKVNAWSSVRIEGPYGWVGQIFCHLWWIQKLWTSGPVTYTNVALLCLLLSTMLT